MTFTLTFGYPMVCFLVTLTMWAGLVLWPMPAPTGSYDFGGAIVGFLRMIAGVIGTLVIWLVYFALLIHV